MPRISSVICASVPDIVDRETRSRMMSGIRGKDTKPEKIVRSGLHARGLRYRLHDKTLPGRPDLVFPKYGAVIFVHGCFWHGHDCHLFKWPQSNRETWSRKIEANRRRDSEVIDRLLNNGTRVLVIWECALKGKTRLEPEALISQAESWLRKSSNEYHIICGEEPA
jgi:DNA mismatch endonuclease (patch repair protein)